MTTSITRAEAEKDVDVMTWAMGLSSVIRYQDQRFWEPQTAQAKQALAIDTISPHGNTIPRSESVADHTWHMNYMIMLIAPRFPELNLDYCLKVALFHDLLEIKTGDKDPLGKKGDGADTHAFNKDKKRAKDEEERAAMAIYLQQVNEFAVPMHKAILEDAIELKTPESRFVKALDRLQTYMYITARKDGVIDDEHIDFTLKYLSKYHDHFPALEPYHDVLRDRLLESIADRRGVPLGDLEAQFIPPRP